MEFGVSIASALGAAISFAFAAVLQQEATQSIDEDKSLTIGLLRELLRRRKWLLGGACLLTGFGLQALALSYGPIAVVQPIVVTELAFAIPLGILRRHRRAGLQEWAGIGAVMSGVAIFLLVASPSKGIGNPPTEDWIASLVPVGAVAATAAVLGAARRGPKRAMFLGAAA
ncbi:MAG: DMT family transporter, partial [Acidimicrobiales bacterium]|nr:DMT family transporter [Acidimicrobiales bacterium]